MADPAVGRYYRFCGPSARIYKVLLVGVYWIQLEGVDGKPTAWERRTFLNYFTEVPPPEPVSSGERKP